MLVADKLIKSINKRCKSIFAESGFYLQPDKTNKFRLAGSSMSYAINRYKNNPEKVKVLEWFEDYWIFIELRFIDDNTFISISIFQGEESDDIKHQLFRAEWDDYNNPEENHPQPHWHITSNQAIEGTFEEYSNAFDDGNFISTLKEIRSNIIDINRIHFAMNGNWQNNENHVHSLNDEDKVVKWFQGVLLHLRTELAFIK